MSGSEALEPAISAEGVSPPADANVASNGQQVVVFPVDLPVSAEVFDLLTRLAPYAPEILRDDPGLELGLRLDHVICHVDAKIGALWDHEAGLPDFKPKHGWQECVVRGEKIWVFDSGLYARAKDLIDGLGLTEARVLLSALQGTI